MTESKEEECTKNRPCGSANDDLQWGKMSRRMSGKRRTEEEMWIGIDMRTIWHVEGAG
jgi:hypothetical protein